MIVINSFFQTPSTPVVVPNPTLNTYPDDGPIPKKSEPLLIINAAPVELPEALYLFEYITPFAVIFVTPVSEPLTFLLPSKLCPQIVLVVCSLVAVAAFPVQAPEVVAVPALAALPALVA